MSLERSNSSSLTRINATDAQPTEKIKKVTTNFLHDDVWRRIVPYIDSETLTALSCASKTTRDAAVFRDVANCSFSLAPMTKCHFVEFVK